MDAIWWQIFDLLGTTAFAVSGVFAAISRRMDLFGIFVLSAATAVGGGIIRDILIGNIPPAAFKNSIYLWIILGSMAVITIIVRYFNIRMWRRVVGKLSIWYLVCDAIGLGSFTVTGTLLGCFYYPDYWILDITLGVLTAVAASSATSWPAASPASCARRSTRRRPSWEVFFSTGRSSPLKYPWKSGLLSAFPSPSPSAWSPSACTSISPGSAASAIGGRRAAWGRRPATSH